MFSAVTAQNQVSKEADDRFLAWFVRQGGTINKIGLAEFDGMGRGILATKDVKSEEEIIRVPTNIIFAASTLASSKDSVHQTLVKSFGIENEEQIVISALLLEDARGRESNFFEYLTVLPRYIPNLSHFSRENLKELQQPDLEMQVLQEQQALESKFPLFLKTISPLWPGNAALPTIDQYRWAASIVDSRGLRFKGRVYLAPLADMFNYAPHTSSRPANSGQFFLTHHQLQEKDGFLSILADRDQSAGTQLCEDYGDNLDKIYLHYHGFVPESNPFRCIAVQAPAVGSMEIHQEELVRALGFKQPPLQCLGENGHFDEGMVVYHAASVSTQEESTACIALKNENMPWPKLSVECGFKQVQTELLQSKASPSDLTQRARRAMHASLISLQSQQANIESMTSIAQDEAHLKQLLADNQAVAESATRDSEHKIMAIKYRLLHKQLLTKLAEKHNPEAIQASNESGRQLQQKLERFNAWFQAAGPSPNKLSAAYIPGLRVGTIATQPIANGEQYLGVPTSIIMDSETAWKSEGGVGGLLQALSAKYNNARDDFHELAFSLLYHYFVAEEKSPYWPYLSLLPTRSEMDIPPLWSDEDIQTRLAPSSAARAVVDYKNKTRKSFDSVSNLTLVSEFFASYAEYNVWSWESYQWATAILDSRSIWWSGKRHLVPMLDFVNCIEGPDGSKVHSTSVNKAETYALTAASWSFTASEQVFENYGQPNSIYFTYHGFTLPLGKNSHDCIQHEFELTDTEAKAIDWGATDGIARELAQRLYFRERPATTACLKTPLPESVWLFLSLRMNNFSELKKINVLGRPTNEAKVLLVRELEMRMSVYSAHTTDHEASAAFLATERRVLADVLSYLTKPEEEAHVNGEEL